MRGHTQVEESPAVALRGLAHLWRRYRTNRSAVAGGGLLILFLVVAVGAPWIATHDPLAQDLYGRLSLLPGNTRLGRMTSAGISSVASSTEAEFR